MHSSRIFYDWEQQKIAERIFLTRTCEMLLLCLLVIHVRKLILKVCFHVFYVLFLCSLTGAVKGRYTTRSCPPPCCRLLRLPRWRDLCPCPCQTPNLLRPPPREGATPPPRQVSTRPPLPVLCRYYVYITIFHYLNVHLSICLSVCRKCLKN